jgi:hypothetical protein
MHATKQDNIALWSQYGDTYNEIVRPERKYAISHYMRARWAPYLGAARFWFVIALRQRCFWNDKQDWCIVDKKTLARESGLSLRTVNRIIAAADEDSAAGDRDGLAAWFFGKTRRRRYNQRIGRTVNAPNRYHVMLDDPLTPDDQRALAHYLQQHLTDRSPEGTLQLLQSLNDLSETALYDALAETARDEVLPAAFVIDVVQAHCPLPEPKSALYCEIARAASQLHNVLTRPERAYIGNQYYRLHWAPALGPALSLLVINLRARCYWNVRTGELRDTCHASWAELAAEIGCTARQLRNLRQNADLDQFVELLCEGHGRARSQFRVCMSDPLTHADRQRFEKHIRQEDALHIDPETGQIDAADMLMGKAPVPETPNAEELAPANSAQAESMAPGQTGHAEILAQSERKFWHIDGLQAEVLASQPGNSGTDLKLLFMTPTQKGLAETALSIPSGRLTDGPHLAAAALNLLLAQMGLQQPNRGRIVARRPRCDWVVAWSLYVLTQPGLSANKPGYVYNRLWAQDPPPPDFVRLAVMPLAAWRRFVQAVRRREPHLSPAALEADYGVWKALLGPILGELRLDLEAPVEKVGEGGAATQAPRCTECLPAWIRSLIDEDDQVEPTEAGWEIVTWDLYHAYRLARLVQQQEMPSEIAVFYCDEWDVEHVLNAEILALAVEPLAGPAWNEAKLELAWLMPRSVLERQWRGVQPLGIVEDDVPCVVLCAPTEAARDWIVSRQLPLVERTLGEILGLSLRVRFVVYGRRQPVPSLTAP